MINGKQLQIRTFMNGRYLSDWIECNTGSQTGKDVESILSRYPRSEVVIHEFVDTSNPVRYEYRLVDDPEYQEYLRLQRKFS